MLNPYTSGGLNLLDKNIKYRSNLIIFSLGFNNSYHCSSVSAVKSAIKTIKHIIFQLNTQRVYIIGVSMGGSLALNVLSLMDNNLQKKVYSVAAIMPIIDYEYTIKNSKRENIYKPLLEFFNEYNNPKLKMKQSSPINYVNKLPRNTKIILVEGIKDTYVCSSQIEKYYKEAKKRTSNVELVKWNTDHTFVEVEKEFKNLLHSIID